MELVKSTVSSQPVSRSLRRTILWLMKPAGAVAVAGLALLAILLLFMWMEHKTAITLPTPNASFAVGRTTYAWTNEAEADPLGLPPGSKRQVLVWVWYPAIRSQGDVPAEYLPAPWRAALANQLGVFMRSFFKRDPATAC